MNQILTTLLAIILGVGYFLFNVVYVTSNSEIEENQLIVKILDVGQGDATLIQTYKETVLIDTGDIDERDKLLNALQKANVKKIDKIILTHPHSDHIGGMSVLIDEFDIGSVYDNGMPSKSNIYLAYMKKLRELKIPINSLTAGNILDLGNNVSFEVLFPTLELLNKGQDKNYKHDPNNESVAGILRYNEFAIIFTGDAEQDVEKMLVEIYGKRLNSTVLKAGHHGSNTSSTSSFLRAVAPRSVVISRSIDNEYGHPHKETIKKYNLLNLDIYDTAINGTVTIVTDGKEYIISSERGNKK